MRSFKSTMQSGCNLEPLIEEMSENEPREYVHYLLHRAVWKKIIATAIRPVIDASCKKKNYALNDSVTKGMNSLELLPAILLKFRE